MVVKGHRFERGDATRSALVAAARKLFGERGYAATSLDDVVSLAGVTKGALYHHFTDKEHLFLAVAESVKRETTEHLSDLFLSEDPFEALEHGCQAILDAYLDPAIRQIVWIDARSVLGPAGYQELQSRYEPVFLRATLRRAMRLGVIDTQPLRPLTALLTGAIGEACSIVAESSDRDIPRAELGAALSRLLQGLRSTPQCDEPVA
jgi:AcrR family transcriptional regulator